MTILHQSDRLIYCAMRLCAVFITWLSCMACADEATKWSTVVQYAIKEELPKNTIIGNLLTDTMLRHDHNADDIRLLRFRVLPPEVAAAAAADSDGARLLGVDGQTGDIAVLERIDRDALCPHLDACALQLDVVVYPAQFFHVISVHVSVDDVNDNAPRFAADVITLNVPESSARGRRFALPPAADDDSPLLGVRRYALRPAGTAPFTLGRTPRGRDLYLVVSGALDHEATVSYRLTLVALDGGDPPRTGSVTLFVRVVDVNDNAPQFDRAVYTADASEYTEAPSALLTVVATDVDSGEFGKVRYGWSDVTARQFGRLFDIDASSGRVTLIGALDHERRAMYELTAVARDTDLFSEAVVVVRVGDENDNAPRVVMDTLTSEPESRLAVPVSPGTFVVHVIARDRDSGANGDVTCRLSPDAAEFTLVSIQANQLKLLTAENRTWKAGQRYTVCVTCTDRGQSPLTTVKCLNVTTHDANEHAPRFGKKTYYSSITENNRQGAFIIRMTANDSDTGDNGMVRYRITNVPPGVVSIERTSGIVRASMAFDYETVQQWRLHVVATDMSTKPKSSTATVTLYILDRNDEYPIFQLTPYFFTIVENSPINSSIGEVIATDGDNAPYNIVRYLIASDPHSALFAIDHKTGFITTRAKMDREQRQRHLVTIVATNPGSAFNASTTVHIDVLDANDNTPTIEYPSDVNNTVRVRTALPANRTIATIRARDADAGRNARLRFVFNGGNDDGFFRMNAASGAILTGRDLPTAETRFALGILVRDDGAVPLEAASVLHVYVIDLKVEASRRSHQAALVAGTVCALLLAVVFVVVFRCVVVGGRRGRLTPCCHVFCGACDARHDAAATTDGRRYEKPRDERDVDTSVSRDLSREERDAPAPREQRIARHRPNKVTYNYCITS